MPGADTQRRSDADEFYRTVLPSTLTEAETLIARQAYAGLLWTKQFYHYVVREWLDGDLADWSRALLAELEAGWSDDPVRLATVHTYRRYAIPVEHLERRFPTILARCRAAGFADAAWHYTWAPEQALFGMWTLVARKA